jgi:hypothetical protein
MFKVLKWLTAHGLLDFLVHIPKKSFALKKRLLGRRELSSSFYSYFSRFPGQRLFLCYPCTALAAALL